jgi:hypothetical protein
MSKFVLTSTGVAVAETDVTSFPDGTFQQTSSGLQVTKLVSDFMLAQPQDPPKTGGNPEFEAKVLAALENLALKVGGQTLAIKQLKDAITG